MRVPQTVMDAIGAHARRDFPHECCGLLIGDESQVIEAVPTQNVAAEPLRAYEVSPRDHFMLIRRCRTQAGVAIIGGYHSHPHGKPEPSPTDRDRAFSDFLYLIVGPADGSGPLEVRGYRWRDGAMEPVTLSIVD